jgi:hypothetical protein
MADAGRFRTTLRASLAAGFLIVSGCAYFATTPDSPARKVHFRDLNQPAGGDRHYLLVFGAQTVPKLPRFTHTWVTFVRVGPPVPGRAPDVEHQSISWMPATLEIQPWRYTIEPGVNLDLDTSVRMALDHDERVSLWGPYEVPPGLYRKFLIQKSFVESGAIGYQCIDTVGEAARTGRGSNCIHAISDADSLFGRQAYPLTYFGDAASLHILRLLVARGAVPDPDTTHDWLIPVLHLDQHPIVRREYAPPLFPNLPRFGPMLP